MFDLKETVALLRRTPAVLDALLRDLPDTWTKRNEGGETWSAYDVVGHLIHGEEADWIPRAKILLQYGEGRAFDKFDRLAQFRASEGKSLGELLETFARLRAKSLEDLRALNLRGEDFSKRGRHPSLGAVTLGNLLATWPVHDMTHLHQISRIMAHQYREAVGPWTEYMGVLKCEGHSG